MTDKIVSVYWFLILFIVTFAIVSIVYSLYGKPLDVREMEALFLTEKMADCVVQGGKIFPSLINEKGEILLSNETLLRSCGLNFQVENFKDWNNDQFFVSILFLDNKKDTLTFFASGNFNLKENANFNFLDSKKEKFPFCEERSIYAFANEKIYTLKITACVRKTEKNV
jgi:hypothetical protein